MLGVCKMRRDVMQLAGLLCGLAGIQQSMGRALRRQTALFVQPSGKQVECVPASCITFLSEQAFAQQNTRF